MRYARSVILTGALMCLGAIAEASTFQMGGAVPGETAYQAPFENGAQIWAARLEDPWQGPEQALLRAPVAADPSSRQGLLDNILRHKAAHVAAFGTLWELNRVYTPFKIDLGQNRFDPQRGDVKRLGAFAPPSLHDSFAQLANTPPHTLDGPHVMAGAHWEGVWTDGTNDLLTGSIRIDPSVLTHTTLQTLRDLGYLIAVPVPVPAAGLMLLLVLGLAWLVSRLGGASGQSRPGGS